MVRCLDFDRRIEGDLTYLQVCKIYNFIGPALELASGVFFPDHCKIRRS